MLGASTYTYAEATLSQTLPDWLGSHVRMLEYFGGAPEIIVPDNLRSGVSRACRYDPDLNPSYQQWAEHYQVAVVPARPYKPKDKSKAEVGVQIVERWILARLRHHSFFSLAEVNHCIRALLEELNEKPFKQLPGNRRQAFELLDQVAQEGLAADTVTYTSLIDACGKAQQIDHAFALFDHMQSIGVPPTAACWIVRVALTAVPSSWPILSW